MNRIDTKLFVFYIPENQESLGDMQKVKRLYLDVRNKKLIFEA
jgi:hypothetical protein